MHGEVDFLMALEPRHVLDAGCGSGRVAIELARRGVSVVGVDVEEGMLATARSLAPELSWIQEDLAALDLDDRFDVVEMAGNVMLFVEDRDATVAACARHLEPEGLLVAGFQLTRRSGPGIMSTEPYDLDRYDGSCTAAGLTLVDRYATWDRDPFPGDGSYAVSVHRCAG
jgi:SAM-dependent methyltransferase